MQPVLMSICTLFKKIHYKTTLAYIPYLTLPYYMDLAWQFLIHILHSLHSTLSFIAVSSASLIHIVSSLVSL